MVGSAGYRQGQDGAVNGALARRQPGSALKPFTYALGFEHLYTPATVVADVKTRYLGAGGERALPAPSRGHRQRRAAERSGGVRGVVTASFRRLRRQAPPRPAKESPRG